MNYSIKASKCLTITEAPEDVNIFSLKNDVKSQIEKIKQMYFCINMVSGKIRNPSCIGQMKLGRFSFILFCFFTFGCRTKHQVSSKSSPDMIGTDIYKNIEQKYAAILGTNKEAIFNKKLYLFIDEWYSLPYQYGGKTKKGIDCSGFTSILYKEVFGKELTGSSVSMYNQCSTISKKELREGDLVFFRIDSKEISHVGIYLQNNKFVHATTKKGIMINDLNEEYYRKYFGGSGQINR